MSGPPPASIPRDVRIDLAAFTEAIGARLGGYGRARAVADYISALLTRSPGQRLARTLGGSRSSRAEAARTLLTKSTWEPGTIAYALLDRLHERVTDDQYVWSIQAFGLRADESSDEPRFNTQVVSAAYQDGRERIEVLILASVNESDAWPRPDVLVGSQLHLLEHLRDRSAQRRVLSYGAVSPGNRWRYARLGWRYFQLLPAAESTTGVRVVHASGETETLGDVHAQVLREGIQRWARWQANISSARDATDWPEYLYALPVSEHRTHFFVTNMGPDWVSIAPVLSVAERNSITAGWFFRLGGGAYRGPSHEAFLRHLALVSSAIAFLDERLAKGCLFARRIASEAAELHWRQALRELPAVGLESSPEIGLARSLLDEARAEKDLWSS